MGRRPSALLVWVACLPPYVRRGLTAPARAHGTAPVRVHFAQSASRSVLQGRTAQDLGSSRRWDPLSFRAALLQLADCGDLPMPTDLHEALPASPIGCRPRSPFPEPKRRGARLAERRVAVSVAQPLPQLMDRGRLSLKRRPRLDSALCSRALPARHSSRLLTQEAVSRRRRAVLPARGVPGLMWV